MGPCSCPNGLLDLRSSRQKRAQPYLMQTYNLQCQLCRSSSGICGVYILMMPPRDIVKNYEIIVADASIWKAAQDGATECLETECLGDWVPRDWVPRRLSAYRLRAHVTNLHFLVYQSFYISFWSLPKHISKRRVEKELENVWSLYAYILFIITYFANFSVERFYVDILFRWC